MNLVRTSGLFVATPLIAFGLFLLLRGDPGDGFQGPLIVGLSAFGLGLLVVASTFGGARRIVPVAVLAILAVLPYRDLVGSVGIVVNVAFVILAVLVVWLRVVRQPEDLADLEIEGTGDAER